MILQSDRYFNHKLQEKIMFDTIKEHYELLTKNEKIYAKTVVPIWISWTIYIMLGIPIIMP